MQVNLTSYNQKKNHSFYLIFGVYIASYTQTIQNHAESRK